MSGERKVFAPSLMCQAHCDSGFATFMGLNHSGIGEKSDCYEVSPCSQSFCSAFALTF